MRQQKLEAIAGSGKSKYHQNFAEYVMHTKRESYKLHLLLLQGPSPQRKLLPKVPHTQQILGSLVSIHTKFQQNKLNRKTL